MILLEKLDKQNLEVECLIKNLEENIKSFRSSKLLYNQEKSKNILLNNKKQREKLSQLKHELRQLLESVKKAKELEILLRQNSIRLSVQSLEQILQHNQTLAQLKSQILALAEEVRIIFNICVISRF